MSIRITGTTSSDSKTLVPPIILGSDSGYNKIGLRRVEFTYTNKVVLNIISNVNNFLWYKSGYTTPHSSIEIAEGYYDSNKIVNALNTALSAAGALYVVSGRVSSGGIKFSADSDDTIIMQVYNDYIVLLGSNAGGIIHSIGDALGFSSNKQGSFDPAMVGGTPYEAVEKAMYFSGTYKAWNKMRMPDNSGVRWISVDCDLVNPEMNYVEYKQGFLKQSSSLYIIDSDDINPGEKVDVHIPNVLFLPTRGDIDGISSIEINLTDQNENLINIITDVVATIEISK